MRRSNSGISVVLSTLLILAGCGSGKAPSLPLENDSNNASEQQGGERLFVETRFAEYFAAHRGGGTEPPPVGDPVVNQVQSPSVTLPGPFAGQSINCRS